MTTQASPETTTIGYTRLAQPADRANVVDVLSAAFAHDPVFEWMLPDPAARAAHLPGIFHAFATVFARHDQTRVVPGSDGTVVGAALWAPPGNEPVHPDDGELLGECIAQLPGVALERSASLMALFEQHHPHEPLWYLQFLGVDPTSQSRGHGSELLVAVLDRCDRNGEAAYLEATSARNRGLYERHGFVVTADLPLPDGPTVYAMHRTPR